MESGIIKKPKLKSYLFMALYEYIGMMIFLIGINCSTNDASVAALGLFIAATLTGRLSGGHFNMAITFAVYLVEAKWLQNLRIALAVMAIDIIGAFSAMIVSIGLLGTEGIFKLVPPGYEKNPTFSYLIYLLLVEAIFTMLLVSTVLFVKYRRVSATTDGMLSNLTVAIALYVAVRMGGPLSGGGVNPSIAIAIIVVNSIIYLNDGTASNDNVLVFLFPYILGPLLGGLMSAGLLHLSEKITIEIEDDEEMANATQVPVNKTI